MVKGVNFVVFERTGFIYCLIRKSSKIPDIMNQGIGFKKDFSCPEKFKKAGIYI
jgi:hypothetical protein